MVSHPGAASEIAGDGALKVNPFDTAEIARGISALHDDETLRGALIARGHEVAQRFTLESFAARLAPLYERFV
jgi:glycosyltransferase involved in cell wall biosynthesis